MARMRSLTVLLSATAVLLLASWGGAVGSADDVAAGDPSASELTEGADATPDSPGTEPALHLREARVDLGNLVLSLLGEALTSAACPTPTVTMADVPLLVLSASESEIRAELPPGLEPAVYRIGVLCAPEASADGDRGEKGQVPPSDAIDVAVEGALPGEGDITAVLTPAGGGLQGGADTGDVSLRLVGCAMGQVLKSSGAGWACAADEDKDSGVNAVVNGGGITGSIAGRTLTLGSTATSANVANAIVARNASGSFSAGSISLAGNLDLPNTTSTPVGVVNKGGTRFLHNYGTNSTFLGAGAGNLTSTGAGGHTAVGTAALAANTNGVDNSAFGRQALTANTGGYHNSAFGAGALQVNVGGDQNAAFGRGALTANTEGSANSAFGNAALESNTTGIFNAALGHRALRANTTGSQNSAFGALALAAATAQNGQSAFGYRALASDSGGFQNSAFGANALGANTAGERNAAFGYGALSSNTAGTDNAAFGYHGLEVNTTGFNNTACGSYALLSNTTGVGNGAFGAYALLTNTTGRSNTAVGMDALNGIESGDSNIAVGAGAGAGLRNGSRNIFIGSAGLSGDATTIRIGRTYGDTGTVHTATYVGGISGRTAASGVAVYVNSDGKLGTLTSSARDKQEIADMSADSDALMRLRPVSFYYRPELDGTHTRQYGLVAEEVAQVAPELVVWDESGAPQTVRYHAVNAMLLNELQKQQRRLEAQERRFDAQETEIRALQAALERLSAP